MFSAFCVVLFSVNVSTVLQTLMWTTGSFKFKLTIHACLCDLFSMQRHTGDLGLKLKSHQVGIGSLMTYFMFLLLACITSYSKTFYNNY